jgi:hypothetical protein
MGRFPNLLSWTPPKGGCCGFVHLHLPEGVLLADVAERLVEDHGVLILPGIKPTLYDTYLLNPPYLYDTYLHLI